MSVKLLQVDDSRWVDFISKHPEANIFHHPAWINMLADCYGYVPFLLAVIDEDNQITAGLPYMEISSWNKGRKAVALPFSDFVQPLGKDESSILMLIKELQSIKQENKWLKADIHWSLLQHECVYHYKTVIRHLIYLKPEAEYVLQNCRDSVVRMIRKAEKEGLSVHQGRSWNDVRTYYDLHLQTRKRLGTPVQPLRFFKSLWEHLISKDLGFCMLCYKNSELVAGATFLHWNKVFTYKCGASDPAFWHFRPNNLLFWHAIRWGCENNFKIFDWGKTDPDNKGLCQFKRGWGSEEQVLHYAMLADNQPSHSESRLGRSILSRVIKSSPAWVCRAIGELFYKYAA